MKIVDAHYTFGRSRMVVTFGAEGRVSFRPLIHALSSVPVAESNCGRLATETSPSRLVELAVAETNYVASNG
jgi:hypothetical protein